MRLCYFAWIRQRVGVGEEQLPLPLDIATVGDLITFLAKRGGGYGEAFAEPARLRAAVNQIHVGFEAAIKDDDEVAFFPPVTGG